MRIICISGKAGCGKDYTAKIMKQKLEDIGSTVKILHFADFLKFVCREWFDWDGKKDLVGRSLLQRVGTDCMRSRYLDFWVESIAKLLDVFDNQWDYVLIPDTRYKNEIEILRNFGFNVFTVRVMRKMYEVTMTLDQAKHSSETELDSYNFDYYVENDTLVEKRIEKVLELIMDSGIYLYKDDFGYLECDITRSLSKTIPVWATLACDDYKDDRNFKLTLMTVDAICGEVTVQEGRIVCVVCSESFSELNCLVESYVGEKITIYGLACCK